MKRLACIIALELLLVVALRPSAQAVDTEGLLRQKLVAMFGLDTTTCQVEILAHGFAKQVGDSAQLELLPRAGQTGRGLITVSGTLIESGSRKTNSQVQARIRAYQDVYVSRTNLARSTILSGALVTLEHRETTTLTDEPVTDLAALAGLRLKRTIGQGQILTLSMFEVVPDIDRGEEITIQYGTTGFTVTASGEAMESGQAGGTIKVKNKASGKLILARVLDGHTVAIAP